MKVMVVDDDGAQRDMLGMLLRTVGHEVITAEHGLRCLRTVGAFAPDVVVLDLQMPGMDGLEVARALRRLTTTRTLRIVLLTGAERVDPLELHSAGCDALVRKPASADDLIAALVRAPNPSVLELAFFASKANALKDPGQLPR